MSGTSPPPTRQLYVRFPSRLPHDSREVKDIFSKYGQVKWATLVGSKSEAAIVTFWQTGDAYGARRALHGTSVLGIRLSVDFSRCTRLLMIDNYPSQMSREDVCRLIRVEFSRFCAPQWVDPIPERRCVYIFFSSEGDAARIVQELQGHVSGNGWRWEIEFHKEDAHKASYFALHSTTPIPAAAAPSPTPTPITNVTLTPTPTPNKETPTPTPAAAATTETPVEPKLEPKSSPRPPRRSRSRSRSLSPRERPKRSRSPVKKARRSRHSEEEEFSRSSSPSSSSSSSCVDYPTFFPWKCTRCEDALGHLQEEHPRLSEDRVTKKLVKAWFHGNFEYVRAGSRRKITTRIRKFQFLREHLNPFLESVGLPRWTSSSAIYSDWFQRKVLRLSSSERHSTQTWRFHRFTSKVAFKQRLQELLDSLEGE